MKAKGHRHLLEWESALEAEVEELRQQRNKIDTELQKASRKLELIREFYALEKSPDESSGAEGLQVLAAERPTPNSVREVVKRIIAGSGRPLHISEIHRRFVEEGHPIPGSGTPFNILAHMVNDKSFVRVARGTYALSETVPVEQVSPKTRRKRKSKRRRKKNTALLGKSEK